MTFDKQGNLVTDTLLVVKFWRLISLTKEKNFGFKHTWEYSLYVKEHGHSCGMAQYKSND